MSEEKQKRTEILVPFYIRDAGDISTSDFNSLILRLAELRDYIDSNRYYSKIEIDQHNYNIEAIQSLLNNFKIKRINNEKSNTL